MRRAKNRALAFAAIRAATQVPHYDMSGKLVRGLTLYEIGQETGISPGPYRGGGLRPVDEAVRWLRHAGSVGTTAEGRFVQRDLYDAIKRYENEKGSR